MQDNNDLVNMLRAVIQDELKPIRQELRQVNTRLDTLEAGQQELRQEVQELKQGQANLEAGQANLEAGQADLKKGQSAIEAAVNDLRSINRQTHKKIFTHLNALWDDIKLLSTQEERSIR